MIRLQREWRWAFLFCCAWLPTRAQNVQFAPEIDAYLKVNSNIRLSFQAKHDREAGDPVQFQVGPSLQVYLKPLIKLKHVPIFDVDDSKARFLVLEGGFRYITQPDKPIERRMLVAFTTHYTLKGGFLISDRNRADLDWQSRSFSWRYRNKFTVERSLPISSYYFSPYVAVEPFYVSQYSTWSTTALYAGFLFPIGKHVQFDSYYKNVNNTGSRPNSQDKVVGLALSMYFSVEQR